MVGSTLWLVVLGWSLTGTAWADPPMSQPAKSDGPRIEITPDEFAFGEVWEGAKAEQQFTVRNTGNKPLTVTVKTSCGCTPATQPKSPVPPGGSSTFTLKYRTTIVGPANKVAWVNSNDPVRPKITIPVNGIVRPVFALSPARRMILRGLDLGAKTTETLRLHNDYDKPVMLKLQPDQDFGCFDVSLRELKKGRDYELVVSTKPPLRMGPNTTSVKLETDLKDVPLLIVRVFATATPLMHVAPSPVFIHPASSKPARIVLAFSHRRSEKVRVKDITCSLGAITWKLEEDSTPKPGSVDNVQRLAVTLPAYQSVPEGEHYLEVHTTADNPDFAVIKVPVQVVRPVPASQRAPQPRKPVRPGQSDW
jgi:hypothetical protein